MRTWTNGRALRVASTIAAATATTGVAAGCGDSDKKSSSSSAKPSTFAMVASAQGKKKLTLSTPSSVPAGLVTLSLKNDDTQPRAAQIVRIVGNHSVDDVLKVTDSDAQSQPIPDWIQDGGGIEGVAPGKTETAEINLAPGRYAVWDDGGGGDNDNAPTNDQLGAKGEFTVTGSASDAKLPAEPATITATDKGETGDRFVIKGLHAGTNHVRFENTGTQLHHAQIFPYTSKTATAVDIKKLFSSNSPPKGPPPIDFEHGIGTAVIDGGKAENIDIDIAAGRYVVVCFLNDRDGGKPHLMKGMITDIDVK